MSSILTSGTLGINITPYAEKIYTYLYLKNLKSGGIYFLPLLTSAFLEIMKLSSAHMSAMYCSSHFFQASVGTLEGGNAFLYGDRYRRASEMAPFCRTGNTSKGIRFHPQIYESPKLSDYGVTSYLYSLKII